MKRDYLGLAKQNWDNADGGDTQSAMWAASAALISIAESLAQIADTLEEITHQPDLENERQELLARNAVDAR
jgi:hypothetical protein